MKSTLKNKNNLNIENNQSNSLRTSYSSNHIITTIDSGNNNTYLKSSTTPKMIHCYCKTIQVENPKKKHGLPPF